MKSNEAYPFHAIVGQGRMKDALLLAVVDPTIGGVLIRGEKGTGKSTAVRGLERILGGKKVVELPLGSTEDRVAGTLDIEQALTTGEKKFEPGILFQAHGQILYIDEINLLEDHIVDIILDAAAMGVNYIEREGISYSHPSRFVLVGTMNPEEGELRPQLIDRFGLSVEIAGEQDEKARIEVLKRRLEYERDPAAFVERYLQEEKMLRAAIDAAVRMLASVGVPEPMMELTARIALKAEIDGHRGDITMVKAARVFAALDGRLEVERSDILRGAELALPHRRRRTPFEDIGYSLESLLADA
jgi:Mg-chelatase subunit ChlI